MISIAFSKSFLDRYVFCVEELLICMLVIKKDVIQEPFLSFCTLGLCCCAGDQIFYGKVQSDSKFYIKQIGSY
jgi:hypothetical protein